MLKIFRRMTASGGEYICVDAIKLIRGKLASSSCLKGRLEDAKEIDIGELYNESNIVRLWLCEFTSPGSYKNMNKGIAKARLIINVYGKFQQ